MSYLRLRTISSTHMYLYTDVSFLISVVTARTVKQPVEYVHCYTNIQEFMTTSNIANDLRRNITLSKYVYSSCATT